VPVSGGPVSGADWVSASPISGADHSAWAPTPPDEDATVPIYLAYPVGYNGAGPHPSPPSETTFYQPGPSEPAPYQPAPYQPASYQPAPYQPASYQPIPYQPAPYQPPPAPEVTVPDWPALAVWRAPHLDEPVPPPGPAPNTSTGPDATSANGSQP
jgi:hypothetical protein